MTIVIQKLPNFQYDAGRSFRGWLRTVRKQELDELLPTGHSKSDGVGGGWPPTKLPINWRIAKLLGRHGKNSEPAFEWVRTLNPSNEQEQQILNSVLKNLEGRKYGEQKK